MSKAAPKCAFPWRRAALLCIWCDLVAFSIGIGILSERVEMAWMEAGPVRQTFNHSPAPGQAAQERVETYWLFGRGFYARHPMIVTTLDFAAPSAPAKGNALAWFVTEEGLPRSIPTVSEDALGPKIKISGWLPLQALVLLAVLGVISALLWRTISAACRNTPLPDPAPIA